MYDDVDWCAASEQVENAVVQRRSKGTARSRTATGSDAAVTPGYVITVDYRGGAPKGGTWPGGRATLRGNYPRGVRTRRRTADDARYIYISYALLTELHLFEQVKMTFLSPRDAADYVITNLPFKKK